MCVSPSEYVCVLLYVVVLSDNLYFWTLIDHQSCTMYVIGHFYVICYCRVLITCTNEGSLSYWPPDSDKVSGLMFRDKLSLTITHY